MLNLSVLEYKAEMWSSRWESQKMGINMNVPTHPSPVKASVICRSFLYLSPLYLCVHPLSSACVPISCRVPGPGLGHSAGERRGLTLLQPQTLRWPRQEDGKFEASLGNSGRPCLKIIIKRSEDGAQTCLQA